MISFLRKYSLNAGKRNKKALRRKLLLLSDLGLFKSTRDGVIGFYCLTVSWHMLKWMKTAKFAV
jgi:hypothetical protein